MIELSQNTMSLGRKIERLRKIKGIKQETLAADLGMTRQSLSRLEQGESIDEEKLEQIAKALGLSSEAIKAFDEEVSSHYFNTFNEQCSGFNFNCTFNPIEKIVRLYDEKIELYEKLLKSEREKIALFESMLKAGEIPKKK